MAQHQLRASPQTVRIGVFDATFPPVMTIESGDTVVVQCVSGRDEVMPPASAGFTVPPELSAIIAANPAMRAGHIVTGPIAIAGAEPGDTLEVRILKIDLAIPYAYNGFRYGAGFLTDDFPYSRVKIVPLDAKRMVGHFGPGIEVPLHPFFGSMGVAPPLSFGRYDSAPPTIIGGNMDDKALVAGTSVFFPVYAPGALFEVGDGHAAQGNGEVDITALETSLTGTLQFILHKGMKSPYPRAETPSAFIAMGFDDDLSRATRKALTNMIDFLISEKGMSRDDAYMLISVAGDVEETELVDRNKGVHVVLQKALFTKK
jgi:acetamidase/formamidase